MSRWNEAVALLAELIRPWVSSAELDEFISRISGRVGGHRALEATEATKADHRALQASSTDVIKPEYLSPWVDLQQWRTFTSASPRSDGGPVTVQYVTARGSGTRGAVLVSVGNAEPAEKYSEQVVDLLAAGFSPVYVLDHRGQGRSTRLLDETFKSHVDDFGHFVQDFRDLVGTVVNEQVSEQGEAGKLFLHCHSMGCAIAFRFLIEEYEAQRPNRFNAVAASSPLIKPNTDPFPYQVAVFIGEAMLLLGLGEEYPPTRGRAFEHFYSPDPAVSQRQQLYRQYCNTKRNATYAAGHTGLCLGDPTANFAANFFSVYTDTFQAFTSGSLSVPILIQQAKTTEDGHDGTVMNAPQEAFCSQQDDCTLTRYPESAHNIWFEADAIRTAALDEVYAFYEQHGGTLVAQNGLPPPPACSWWQFWCAVIECKCTW